MKKALVWVFGIATLVGVLAVRKAYNDINDSAAVPPATSAQAAASKPAQPPKAKTAPAQLTDFPFGADESAIVAKFGSQLEKLAKREELPDWYADYVIPDYVVDGVHLEAILQMDTETHRLRQVMLRKMTEDRPLGIYKASFNTLLSSLTSKYGKPESTAEGKPDETFSDQRKWVAGTTDIYLEHYQMAYGSGSNIERLTIQVLPHD